MKVKNKIEEEFINLLEYHILKLAQLIKIHKKNIYRLRYMLDAVKGSKERFCASDQSVHDIKDCVNTIKVGQHKGSPENGELLPIQREILEEMELFLFRHNIK